jgi:putative sterol carrier protein
VVAYLSDEWMHTAGTALADDPALAEATSDLDLTVAYEVTGTPGGKAAYALRFDRGTVTLEPGPHPEAPVSFTLDYDTAAMIARNELSAQAAFMQGRLKLGGDVTVLIRDGGALDGVQDALSGLRADTEY